MLPREITLAALLLATSLAGCTADTGESCTPTIETDAGAPVCFVTSDGWILQGVDRNPNATDAPTALLLHGFREQHGQYRALAASLEDAGYRVLAIDLRGHGESTRTVQGPGPSIDAFTGQDVVAMRNDVNASQRYLGHPPDAIVGASIGANLALAYAADHGTVDTVVLLSSIPGQGPLEPSRANAAYQGAVLYVAAEDDARAVNTARALHNSHEGGPARLEVFNGTAHGTQHLDNATRRGIVEAWILEHTDASGPEEGPASSAERTRSAPPGLDPLGLAFAADAELDPAHTPRLDQLP